MHSLIPFALLSGGNFDCSGVLLACGLEGGGFCPASVPHDHAQQHIVQPCPPAAAARMRESLLRVAAYAVIPATLGLYDVAEPVASVSSGQWAVGSESCMGRAFFSYPPATARDLVGSEAL